MNAMQPIDPSRNPHRARGFSLIELMVSLTIGLVIAIAAFSAYLGASSSSKMTDAQSRMNEDGQAALAILAQQLRMTGNNPRQRNRTEESGRNPIYLPTPTFTLPTPTFTFSAGAFTLANFRIRGCDGTFANVTSTTATIDSLNTSTCVSGTSTTPADSIAVNYEADRYNTIPTSGLVPSDCLGNGLTPINATLPTVTPTVPTTITATTFTYYMAENRFYIGTSATILSPSLYCKGNGGSGTQQPLVENIEDMQFTYGTVVSTATTTSAAITPIGAPVAGYLTADQIVNPTDAGLAGLAIGDRWNKVTAVRICVVVRSENPVVSETASTHYYKCDGTLDSTKTDRRLRHAYSTTVSLRNRQLWLP
jgi:type IV pilus assembly protein PilW